MTTHPFVYRIATEREWNQLCKDGVLGLSLLDRKDGFVHLSTAATVLETADLYYGKYPRLRVLKLNCDVLGKALRFEPVATRAGALFPHYYGGPLKREQIESFLWIESESGGFSWGKGGFYDNDFTV
jgi:uncharacterized protein (DUF952 family)